MTNKPGNVTNRRKEQKTLAPLRRKWEVVYVALVLTLLIILLALIAERLLG